MLLSGTVCKRDQGMAANNHCTVHRRIFLLFGDGILFFFFTIFSLIFHFSHFSEMFLFLPIRYLNRSWCICLPYILISHDDLKMLYYSLNLDKKIFDGFDVLRFSVFCFFNRVMINSLICSKTSYKVFNINDNYLLKCIFVVLHSINWYYFVYNGLHQI